MHAGKVTVEEITLLGDAFFLLIHARNTSESMITAANSDGSYSKPKANPQIYGRIAALNSSVCTYSRLGVLTAVAFVEAFVNSVGWNEASNPQRSEQERLELQGIHKGNYLSLEKKLEKFSRIICDDNSTPIILSDPRSLSDLGATTPMSLLKAKPLLVGKCLIKIENIGF